MSTGQEMDEDFENFLLKVTEVEKIVKKLSSNDLNVQKEGLESADIILDGKKNDEDKSNTQNNDTMGMTKYNRTVINKFSENATSNSTLNENSPQIEPNVFMKLMEQDAKQRAEDRKIRNERADTYKKIGNSAFANDDYDKAITYYKKALDNRKDSITIWNNRGLAYMKIGDYKKAVNDFDKALRLSDMKNIKALLNSAKCYAYLNNHEKSNEFINLAKQHYPEFLKYITDLKCKLDTGGDDVFDN